MDDVKAMADTAAQTVKGAAGAAMDAVAAAGAKVTGSDKPKPLPEDRAQLLVLHQAARRRRDAAPLLSHERVQATYDLERIEIQIARVERAMDPPLV